MLNTTVRTLALALAASAGIGSAHAGMLSFQDVVFTTSWNANVLTLEIDAAKHGGNWSDAVTLGALGIKDFGGFDSVSLSSAPAGTAAWKLSSHELNADGCRGGGNGNSAKKVLCLSGGPAALADNMVFSFAFTGMSAFKEPHLKVNFLNSAGSQIGELMSKTVTASTVVVTPPGTPDPFYPSGTPGTSPGTPPPVVVPVAPPPPASELPRTNEVPEPHTFALLLTGLALLGFAVRKRA